MRTYPRAVAGKPLYVRYDAASHEFALAFEETGVPGPTEIYIPAARFHPHGFEIHVSDPDGAWSSAWDADREVLSLWTDPAKALHAVTVTPLPAP